MQKFLIDVRAIATLAGITTLTGFIFAAPLHAVVGLPHNFSPDTAVGSLANSARTPIPYSDEAERSSSRRNTTTDWFTEFFSFNDFNLDYKTITFFPAENPNGYVATLDSAFQYPVPPTGDAVLLDLDDDEAISISLAPNVFPLYGVNTSTIYVSSNGIITTTGPNASSNPTIASHFNTPRISAFHTDLRPASGSGGGTITRMSLPHSIVITYDAVQSFTAAEQTNSFQVELFYSGVIRITWLEMQTKRGLVGISKGGGVPPLLFQSSLKRYSTSGLVAIWPSEPVKFTMTEGGASFPSLHPLELTRKSPLVGNWSAATSQPWLQITPSSGNFALNDAPTVSLSPSASATTLDAGTYDADVTFSAFGLDVTTTVAVRLVVTEEDIDLLVTDTAGASSDQFIPFGDINIGDEQAETLSLNNLSLSEQLSITNLFIDGSYIETFEDALAQNWIQRARTGGPDWRVENGRYLAGPAFLTTGFMESLYTGQSFRDVVFEATIEHTGWDSSFAYLAVRGAPDVNGSLVAGSAYLFGISGNNGFNIFRIVNGGVTPILTTGLSPSVRTPPFTNRLRVEAIGPVLTFYANDLYLGGVVDTSLRGAGRVGFVASSVASLDGNFKPAYAFDDVLVYDVLDGSPAFSLNDIPSLPATLAPEGSLAFEALASPSAIASHRSTLKIQTSDSQRASVPVFLRTKGIAPEIGTLHITDSVAPTNDGLLDYGEQLVDTAVSESVTLLNTSDDFPVEVTSAELNQRRMDSFDDPALPGWQPTNLSQWVFDDSSYVANPAGLVNTWMMSSWTEAPFSEGAFTVEVQQTANDENSVYVFIRATADFILFSDGSAFGSALMLGSNGSGFYNLTSFQNGDFRFLQAWDFSEAINTDGTSNAITLEVRDGRVRAAFNGVEVLEAEIPPFIPSGNRPGFFVGTGTQGRSFRFNKVSALSPEFAGPFASSDFPALPIVLPPGGSLNLPITFTPDSIQTFEGQVRFLSNDFNTPLQSIELVGSGIVVPFDFNGDGIVNVADVTILANYISGKIDELPSDGDVNEDGLIDADDVIALALMIVQ